VKPVIDSRQLYAFAAVARRGSFTLAAKDLFLTQSAVSHAMKALEDDVGCRLIDRVGKRVQLTQGGEHFLRHAENILREMQAARAGMEAHSKWGHTRLRIGASTTACQYILPGVLREFREAFPQTTLKLEPGDHDHQIDLLRSAQVDLAIVLEPAQRTEDLVFVPLFEDEMRFFVAPTHPWARQGLVPRDSIAAETLILYNKSSFTFRLISDYFREEKTLLNNFIDLGSMEAIKELAKLGLGAGILAPWIVRAEQQAGTLVSLPLGPRPLTRRWSVAYWKGRRLAGSEENFVTRCVAVTESLGLRGPSAVA
jgi:DNA-binding transcriptional LysR family regulator